ncbi:DUF732 domain-containing protein [Streptomyces hydrogenans]|uniref:DUF732 domain-containing protein n=1 Tax=Streptomyces hydrogenans TaxID=1873719 RepID=A0ABQ3PJQ5_9ACTN|nr:DUF732 domain-containing protein [Streptomyces hydrogenans]GHG09787.1 hypothetical protein GCM10018784_23010 [Streptomyces hydrogenans]GHI25247.1 hypothetical protein Shyd_66180 [Streptomyces hydrogenans]
MSRLGVSILLVAAVGAVSVGCGSSDGGAPAAVTQESTQSAAEQQDAAFLALLDKHGVLSAKSDAALVKIGREVCEQADMLPEFAEGIAMQIQSKDPSLDDEEYQTVFQAAVKTYCPAEAGS